MRNPILLLTCSLFISVFSVATPKPKDYLTTCWMKQGATLQAHRLQLAYQETRNDYDHGMEPFQVRSYEGRGTIWVSANEFAKSDTLTTGSRVYHSSTQWTASSLLFRDYGDADLSAITSKQHQDRLFQQARYTPINLLAHAIAQRATLSTENDPSFAIYDLLINESNVRLFIRKADQVLERVVILSPTDFINDELFGDIVTEIRYAEYTQLGDLMVATRVTIEKMGGKLKEEVKVLRYQITQESKPLFETPAKYSFAPEVANTPGTVVETYTKNIHFVQLPHTDDRSMIVEFNDFLVVAEAPLNSANGELIIEEARKLAPGKPIKYFVFGHFHTHYIGGVRAFVHKGATVLAHKLDRAYVEHIVNAPHTLHPDNLQKEPKPLIIETIDGSKVITDGKFEMKIFSIGMQSQHTADYLVYYFPSEELLFEDDLVWIAREGAVKKAGARQAGLYNAIKELGLSVKMIVQSWPVKDYGVKTIIPFADLEASMTAR